GDDGNVGIIRQLGNRGICFEALHLGPVRIHRQNRALEPPLQHRGDWPATDSPWIRRGANHSYGTRREQSRQPFRHNTASEPRSAVTWLDSVPPFPWQRATSQVLSCRSPASPRICVTASRIRKIGRAHV